MLQMGSFPHLRRFAVCYCLPPSHFGTLTPRHLREPNLATQSLESLHLFTSVGDLVRFRRAVGSMFRTIPARLAGDRVTDSYLHHEVFSWMFQPLRSVPEGNWQFIDARELSCRPVSVHHCERMRG